VGSDGARRGGLRDGASQSCARRDAPPGR
jgi:hypothetical protein